MSSLPSGWENRKNQMSEKDMKLGGDAANKFSSKNAYSDGSVGYKTSDEVKAFYLQQIEQELLEASAASSSPASNLPIGWENRQRNNELQAKQFGVFRSSKPEPPLASLASAEKTLTTASASSKSAACGKSDSAEAALVKVATTTLDTMAECLEHNPVVLTPEERAAFAAAMQRAMSAIAKCR